ncbi:unnamed protein product [Cuscuta campestris]|uniref:CCHC-type domain-containing protein n=1 Tax=Cuscuta campestris TaxID=132261 RepID=A0A484M6Z3_9ASTE|nr:unnamed protein product [Cuscuta campestris]
MKKVGDKLIPKTEDEFDAEDIKKVENYAKAINMLYCANNPDDYRKISCCSTAKKMWDKLEVTYEGTDQVREAKIDFLTQEYEMFRMKEHEKIEDMFDRFSKIVNDLHALKKTYTDRDLVRKILRSLTSEWRSKADAIYESIGTSNVTIDGLRGNLKTYESTILNPSLNDQRKGIALKAVKESTMDDSNDDDEVKLIIKKFCKLLKKKEKVEDGPVCYGCGEAGHIKNKCPRSGRNARHFKRQKAYISWGGDSGDELSEQEEEEEANLCLIAQEKEESTNNENQEVRISSTCTNSFEEMQEALQELYDEFVSASKTNKALKKHFSNLEIEFEKLQKENEKLKEENKFYGKRSADKPESSTKHCDSCIALKEQVAELENTVKKFNKPHKDLNLVFDSMQYTKQGIGKVFFLRVEVLECGISEQVLLRLVGLEFSGCNGLLSTLLECGISEQVLLRLVGLEFSGCNGLLSTRKLNGSSVARENTPPEEPVLEEIEPTTYPQVQESKEESVDEEILCMDKPFSSIETCTNNDSSEDSDQTFFDSLLDGYDYVCPKDGWNLKRWDELLMSDDEDSSLGEDTVIIIKPQLDGQPIEDNEEINLAMKANDVYQLRTLPPPPTYTRSPPFLLSPSRRDESRILDLDQTKHQTGWHQKRVRRAKLYDSRIGKSQKKWVSVKLRTLKK